MVWIDTLRWHVATFWSISFPENCIFPRTRLATGPTFAGDHAKYSGEMIAQGIAIKILEQTGIAANSLYFYPSGNKASLDFVQLEAHETSSTAIVTRDGSRIALEARCRVHPQRFLYGERAKLNRKKKGFESVLAVYFVHAPPYTRKPKGKIFERTKVLLVDPEFESAKSLGSFPYIVALNHYIGVTGRIGLWREKATLESMRSRLGKSLNFKGIVNSSSGRETEYKRPIGILLEKFAGRSYFGRQYSSLIAAMDQMSDLELQQIINSGTVGSVRFFGLSERVLIAIVNQDYNGLLETDVILKDNDRLASFGADGSIFAEWDPDDRTTQYLLNSVQNERESVRRNTN